MQVRKVSDQFSVAPQLAPEDMATLAELGFRSVVNNRPDGEEPGQPTSDEMAAAARAAGLDYVHIPVVSGQLTVEDVQKNGSALDEMDGPILAYCRTGTRCIILWAQDQIMSRGEDVDTVIAVAAEAGYDLSGFRR